MTGPLATTQAGEDGKGLAVAQRLAGLGREQVQTAVAACCLCTAVTLEQPAHLRGQRQGQLGPGLGVLGRDMPLALLQAEVPPRRQAGLGYTGAVAQHHQSQHGLGRHLSKMLFQLAQ
ncbi:hypothetical protein D3C77_623930 [compost metagenome]